jgi:hypothetical protein
MNHRNESITQVYGVQPEQFKESIIKGVQKELENFKKELEPKTPESYLSRNQTAKMLSISLTCLSDWSRKGILNPHRLGNRIYYKLSEIENKLKESRKS